MRRVLPVLVVGLLLLAAFGLGYALSSHRHSEAAAATPVQRVRAELAGRYYRSIPERVLRLESIASIIAGLKDPYTEYLDARGYGLLRQETAQTYSGIGVTLLPGKHGFLVVALQRGPAERAGIRVGDTIAAIGSVPTERLGLAGALTRIIGRRGTVVHLRVLREGRALEFHIRRDEVQAPTVAARLVSFGGRRFGYLRLASFRNGATQVVGEEVRKLQHAHATGLVLDLRENPGGLLDEAVGVSSLFLAKGSIVTLEGRHQPRKVFSASGKPVTRLPLVVLIDRYSASSAEVVAAALQDDHRATLVGEHTFGKAVVQTVDPLGNGDALVLTTARYYTPRGRDISRAGVQPDVHVRNPDNTGMDEVLTTALATLASAH